MDNTYNWGAYQSAPAPKTPADYGWHTPEQDPFRDYTAFAQLNDMLGLLHNQTNQAYDLQGANMGARKQAIENASPLGRQKAVDQQRAKLASAGARAGKEAALRAKAAGYGDQSGALMLESMNNANAAGNQFQNQINSPDQVNASLMQALGLSDPSSVISLTPDVLNYLQSIYAKSGLVDQESAARRGGGLLGGVLGSVAGALPWGKILGL